jgi:hypothetical protein
MAEFLEVPRFSTDYGMSRISKKNVTITKEYVWWAPGL